MDNGGLLLYKDLIICVLLSIVNVPVNCLEPDLVILSNTVHKETVRTTVRNRLVSCLEK